MKQIDLGQDDKKYVSPKEYMPLMLMDSLQLRNIFFAGKKVADIGSGTGALTRKMAMRKADVVGVDSSQDMLDIAKSLNRLKNFTIPFQKGSAEETRLLDSYFDIVTVMRAWHLFDRPKAIPEMKRILKENGTLIIIDARFTEIHEEIFNAFYQTLTGGSNLPKLEVDNKQRLNTFPVEWFAEWQSEGFELRDFYKLNYMVPLTKQEWMDQFNARAFITGPDESIQNELSEILIETLGEEPYSVTCECNVCILRLKE
ncbi:class I SAM-dependent methyltransferase [Neobacillus jeddahensis]|uniref:class I SAM-dependent methyltransferase n=1 Tax=Neobacillus jeddahensis TaxID=1461580 RepID=UPI000693392D|nr:class I SAM-dependent methyltransferase [Neobacillus jeddahensis]